MYQRLAFAGYLFAFPDELSSLAKGFDDNVDVTLLQVRAPYRCMGGSRSLHIPVQPVDDCFRRIPSVSTTLFPERLNRRGEALEVMIHAGHDDEVGEGG